MYSEDLAAQSDQSPELNFNRKPDQIDFIPLLCRIYNTYTSTDDELLITEIDKYALQPGAIVQKLSDIPALVAKLDTYLAEAITSSSQEIQLKTETLANESSLDVAMVNDNLNESSAAGIDEFNDLDSVLNFESKEYTQLANILKQSVTSKKPQEQEEQKVEAENNVKAPEQSEKDSASNKAFIEKSSQ